MFYLDHYVNIRPKIYASMVIFHSGTKMAYWTSPFSELADYVSI
jgi:hypothetical protein